MLYGLLWNIFDHFFTLKSNAPLLKSITSNSITFGMHKFSGSSSGWDIWSTLQSVWVRFSGIVSFDANGLFFSCNIPLFSAGDSRFWFTYKCVQICVDLISCKHVSNLTRWITLTGSEWISSLLCCVKTCLFNRAVCKKYRPQ